MINLTQDDFEQYDISWSADSTQIATFTVPCGINQEVCSAHLEVYDLAARKQLHVIDLFALPIMGGAACSVQFSPNMRYLSFVSNCGSMGIAAFDFARGDDLGYANWRTTPDY
ncbi:MAG: hypothetical protein U0528_13820 [Anaerolineae bacterium]